MKLAAEIPTAHLEDLSPLFDFDFVIAHKMADERYSQFYLERRKQGVMCILDNGFHELGQPMSWKALGAVFDRLTPDFLISPDRLGDPDWTLAQARQLALRIPPTRLAGNVFGGPGERFKMANEYHVLGFGMVCFPYRKRQLSWFDDDDFRNCVEGFSHIHFLGAIDARETRLLAQYFPTSSIDTAKPIKWGIQGKYLNDIPSWHGGWPEYDSYADAKIDNQLATECTLWNIAYLRKLMTA